MLGVTVVVATASCCGGEGNTCADGYKTSLFECCGIGACDGICCNCDGGCRQSTTYDQCVKNADSVYTNCFVACSVIDISGSDGGACVGKCSSDQSTALANCKTKFPPPPVPPPPPPPPPPIPTQCDLCGTRYRNCLDGPGGCLSTSGNVFSDAYTTCSAACSTTFNQCSSTCTIPPPPPQNQRSACDQCADTYYSCVDTCADATDSGDDPVFTACLQSCDTAEGTCQKANCKGGGGRQGRVERQAPVSATRPPIPAGRFEVFQFLDEDGNGAVSKEEFSHFVYRYYGRVSHALVLRYFRQFDANADGVLRLDEIGRDLTPAPTVPSLAPLSGRGGGGGGSRKGLLGLLGLLGIIPLCAVLVAVAAVVAYRKGKRATGAPVPMTTLYPYPHPF